MMKRIIVALRHGSPWVQRARASLAAARDDLMQVLSHLPYNA